MSAEAIPSDEEQARLLDEMARPTPDKGQDSLFEVERSWSEYWWGLPEFVSGDIKPVRELVVQFPSHSDYEEFRQINGFKNRTNHKAVWWPIREREAEFQYCWEGEPSPTRYPIYIPSKGRCGIATTQKMLIQAGVPFHFVVESTEAEAYRAKYGTDRVLELPFHDLGQGSIPARNWIWEHAKENGHPWHWILDDNIDTLTRAHNNRRLIVYKSSAPLRMVEDFADRYDNLAFTGLTHRAFMPDSDQNPLTLNTRIYSMTLINTALPYRWRGRYNEDTDLCLRALKDGWATALFRNFQMQKLATSRGDGKTGLKGGNTDNVYNEGDHRRSFAESLQEQHPDVVEIVWKWNRWHHHVDYTPFKNNQLRLKRSVTKTQDNPDYGLRLVKRPRRTGDTAPANAAPDTTTDEVEDW
jgi:hypothetical protein